MTKFSGANGDREIFIFLYQLTTSRIGNLTRFIHSLAICETLHTSYIVVERVGRLRAERRPGVLRYSGGLDRERESVAWGQGCGLRRSENMGGGLWPSGGKEEQDVFT